MPEYLSPGVYIEEQNLGPRPIEGVGTAMAAFLGFTEKAADRTPKLITNWSQYKEQFGGFVPGAYLPHAVYGYFLNGGSRCYVVSLKSLSKPIAKLKTASGGELEVYGLLGDMKDKKLQVRIEASSASIDALKTLSEQTQEASSRAETASQPIVDAVRNVDNCQIAVGAAQGALTAAETALENKIKETGKPEDSPEVKTEKDARDLTKTTLEQAQINLDIALAAQRAALEEEQKTASIQKAYADASKADAAAQEAFAAAANTFTLIVEGCDDDGQWKVVEKVRGVRLQENPKTRQLELVYPNNRAPKTVQLLLDPKATEINQLLPVNQPNTALTTPEQEISLEVSQVRGELEKRSGVAGLEALDDVTMVCVPDLMAVVLNSSLKEQEKQNLILGVQTAIINHCEQQKDRIAILDAPPDMIPKEIRDWRENISGYNSSYAALYYPWIKVMDPDTNQPVEIPPCGHIAGIWARNDNTRGVHKAPANENVQGALGLEIQITKGEQDILNPVGVNCIRAFPGRGIRVWGARTLSSDTAWKYINVRRLFNYVEESIEESMDWVVFEPNDPKLWARVRRDVSIFLTGVWRDGALFGRTPEEAFYVKCDDELNPPGSRAEGRLIIEIGMAPVKPAEFVIFRISQWAGPSTE